MQVEKTKLKGVLLITPQYFEDERGYFFEAYNENTFNEAGIGYRFIQDNQSFSKRGVIRGLHYQLKPYAQCKLIRVLQGAILDIAVDIRKNSVTYGQYYSVELSAENKMQLLIPHGFAHGFSVLSETAIVMYKCDALYHKESEAGIIYNDGALAINWQIPGEKAIISNKDSILPVLAHAKNNFVYE